MNKSTKTFLLTTALTLSVSIPVSAATFSEYWHQNESGNWYVQDLNGNIIKNAWLCDDSIEANGKDIWYLLDANGNMISSGLVQDQTGNYYSLETNHNGYFGMLRYVSGNYDGITLDLESSHNGSFAEIKNDDAIIALQNKYGLEIFNIDNSNCVYTSTFKEAKKIEPSALIDNTVRDVSGTSHVSDGKVTHDANVNNASSSVYNVYNKNNNIKKEESRSSNKNENSSKVYSDIFGWVDASDVLDISGNKGGAKWN